MNALTADKVVVELEARLAGYNARISGGEAHFKRSMASMQGTADKTERSISKSFLNIRTAAGAMAVGIAGVSLIGLGRDAVETALRFRRLEQSMAVITGSTAAAAKEFDFIRELADRLGVRFISLAEGYRSISASARGTNMEGENTRKIFEAVAKAGVAFGQSEEQITGALIAISQMMSKGKVTAEELRGQLGERLYGAFQTAARGMGVTTQALDKMLETGSVVADDFLPKFAEQLGKEIPGNVEAADASFQRLQTVLDDIANSSADGFMGELRGATDDLADVLKEMHRDGSLEALGAFLGDVIRLGGGAIRVMGGLASAIREVDAAIPGGLGGAIQRANPLLMVASQALQLTRPDRSIGTRNADGSLTIGLDAPTPAIPKGPTGGAALDTSSKRTNQQAWVDFKAALLAEGIRQNRGELTGHRTQGQQDSLVRQGKTKARFSRHQTWQGIDVPLGVSEDAVMKAAGAAGLKGVKIVREPGAKGGAHSHVQWTGHGKPGDVSGLLKDQERAAAEALRAEKERLRDAFDAATDERRASADIVSAQMDISHDIKERGVLNEQMLGLERQQEEAQIAFNLAMGDITETQAQKQREQVAILHGLRVERSKQEEIYELQQERLEQARVIAASSLEVKEMEAQLAVTLTERRRIEGEILAAKFKILRQAQQDIIDDARSSPEQKNAAGRVLLGYDKLEAGSRELLRRQTMSPMEAYRAELSGEFSDINTELEQIEVNALRTLTDELTEASVKALGLSGALGDIAGQLIKIAIQRRFMGPLADFLFGPAQGGGAQAGGSGFLGGILQAGMSLLGGSGAMSSPTSSIGSGINFGIPGMAGGGFGIIGGRGGIDQNVLSINGRNVARVSRGEMLNIIPQGRAIRPVSGLVTAMRPQITVISAPQFDLRNAVTTPQLMREMRSVSEEHAVRAAAAMGKSVMKAVPGRFAQYQTDQA